MYRTEDYLSIHPSIHMEGQEWVRDDTLPIILMRLYDTDHQIDPSRVAAVIYQLWSSWPKKIDI